MGVQITFNYDLFVLRFPEFTYVDPALVQLYFDEATVLHRNDGFGPVRTEAAQVTLLNLLTAHICQLNAPQSNGQPAAQTVGRINTAAEGSVSVVLQNQYPPGTAQYFMQTKYGSAYWTASLPYRSMRYLPGRQRIFNPWPYQ